MPSPSKTKEDIKSKVKDGHEIEFSVMEDSGKRKKYTAIAVAWVDRHDDDNDESLEKLQIRYHNGLEGYVDPDTSEMRLQKCSDKPLTEEEIQAKYKPLVSPGGDEAGRSLAGKDLVGKRVKVWWPDESKFFEGEVQSFDEAKGKHSILYDDGEREDIEFSNEVWQLLGEATKKPKSVKRKAEPKKEEGPAEKKSRSSVKKPPPPPAAARSKSVATPQAVADERAVPVYSSPVALVKTPDYQIWQHAGTPIRYSLYFKVAEGLKASDVVVSNTRAHVQVEVPVDAVQATPDTSPAHAEAPGCPAAPDAVVKSEAQGGASTQPARGSGQEPEEGGSEAAEQSAGTKPASRADAGKQQQRAAASGAATPNGSRGPAGVEAQRRTYVVILPHPCVDTSKTICELTVSGQLYIRCYLDQGLLPPLGPS